MKQCWPTIRFLEGSKITTINIASKLPTVGRCDGCDRARVLCEEDESACDGCDCPLTPEDFKNLIATRHVIMQQLDYLDRQFKLHLA